MPLYAVLFTDRPDADPNIRQEHMADHLSFLGANAIAIQAAGPLRDAEGISAGGMWLVGAPDAGSIDALVKADPFWPTGLRESYRILEWTRVFADGERRI